MRARVRLLSRGTCRVCAVKYSLLPRSMSQIMCVQPSLMCTSVKYLATLLTRSGRTPGVICNVSHAQFQVCTMQVGWLRFCVMLHVGQREKFSSGAEVNLLHLYIRCAGNFFS